MKRILYGEDKLTDDEKDFIGILIEAKDIQFYDDGLYNRLSEENIIEKSGVFYKNEVEGATSSPNNDKIRVITYELQ